MAGTRVRLGELLLRARLVTQAQLDEALAKQKETGRRLGEELFASGVINEIQLTQTLSNQLSMPWVSLLRVELTRELLNFLPPEIAEKHTAIPVYARQVSRGKLPTIYVAIADPTDEQALAALGAAAKVPVKLMVAPTSEIRDAIRVYYFGGTPKPVPEPAKQAGGKSPTSSDEDWPVVHVSEDSDAIQTATIADGSTVRLPRGEHDDASHLTARDLIAALSARTAGHDVSDVLPTDDWEPIVAALLSVLLHKGVIADWDFVEELQKRMRKPEEPG